MSLKLYSERKKVTVTFAGDEHVGKHINGLNVPRLHSKRRRTKRTFYEHESDSDQDSGSNSEVSGDELFKPSEALAAETSVTGDKVFGFKSKRHSSRMSQLAVKSVEAGAAVTSNKQLSCSKEPTTPSSVLRKGRAVSQVLSESGQTPDIKRASRRIKQLATLTPQRLSARIAIPNHESSSEESLYTDSSDEESEMSSGTTSPNIPNKTNTTYLPKKQDNEIEESVKREKIEAYFAAHSMSHVITSDHTLSCLNMPRMDHKSLAGILNSLEAPYKDERCQLMDSHRAQFNKWMFLMCHSYNLVFHGLGSKRSLLEEFRTKMLMKFNHIVINGYFPSLTIKNILNAITEDVMEHNGTFKNPIEQFNYIKKHFECGDLEDFYLVIHNIDGTMLRSEKVQTVLSLLAGIRGFHIIASVDHINAPLLWDSTKCSRFNWLWFDVTTYENYSEETSSENSLLVQQSGALALSSLTHVIRSLTPNAKGIFLLLVKHQLEHTKDNSNYQGLSFADLYQKCREAFLVNSDLTLNSQLTEFKDHRLIKLKKGVDGIEYLIIPLDEATLKEFLEQQEDEQT